LTVRPGCPPGGCLGRGLFCGWLLLATACAPVGPDFVRPEAAPAGQWSQDLAQGLEPAPQADSDWWKVFGDPVLDEFIATARSRNNNLQIAGLRVLEARAQLGIATGQLYPQSQFAAGQATYVSPPDHSLVADNYWQYSLGASASWELDFWGRFRRGIEAADAAYLASIAEYDQVELLLVAAVADVYITVRVVEEQLHIADENLKLQQRSYDIADVLYRQGADSELDMQQAKTLLLATQATLPELEASLAQARNALSTLLGLPPGTVKTDLARGSGIPRVPAAVAIGVPADMLRHRPDVRQAEYLAAAQNALVGLAEADLYPSFSLTGSIGVTAGGPGDSDFGDLFSTDALTFSVGPSFVWPFLNYGRIRNNIRVQDARLQQALVNYRETVLQAAREAEDAIADFIGARAQSVILAETVTAAKRSNDLSTLRYREGFSDYQRVLDAQQALFAQQQRYVNVQGGEVSSLVALYRALGSGWQDDNPPRVDAGTLEIMRQRTDWGELLDEDARPADAESDGWWRDADG
jgi:NodT family efflux transporter outer membrane factor (OMF) lipoprotein